MFKYKFNLKSKKDFEALKIKNLLPKYIPKQPESKFNKVGEWKGWPDFLSYTLSHKGNYLDYENAKNSCADIK